ncbi:unnamed protein product [Prorocentrum cordatum]|uniref:Uncharacterized protein n=1 Tax=Prorocentrum cordatum TaxID=2364126 RepID=A0ABN9PZ72_9DINO|nr:unnamed protein product [Polarella glacialis]
MAQTLPEYSKPASSPGSQSLQQTLQPTSGAFKTLQTGTHELFNFDELFTHGRTGGGRCSLALGHASDHVALAAALLGWAEACGQGGEARGAAFVARHSLNSEVLDMGVKLLYGLVDWMVERGGEEAYGFDGVGTGPCALDERGLALFKLALCASFSPQCVRVTDGVHTDRGEEAVFHSSSVNFAFDSIGDEDDPSQGQWAIFSNSMRLAKLNLMESTILDDAYVILGAQCAVFQPSDAGPAAGGEVDLWLDGWTVRADAAVAAEAGRLRSELSTALNDALEVDERQAAAMIDSATLEALAGFLTRGCRLARARAWRQPRAPERDRCSAMVRGLPESVFPSDLEGLFEPFGHVVDVHMPQQDDEAEASVARLGAAESTLHPEAIGPARDKDLQNTGPQDRPNLPLDGLSTLGRSEADSVDTSCELQPSPRALLRSSVASPENDRQRHQRFIRKSAMRMAVMSDGKSHEERTRSLQDKQELIDILAEKGGGSFLRGWRQHLDADGTLEVRFAAFCQAAAQIAWSGDVYMLLGGDQDVSSLTLDELCPSSGALVRRLKRWVKDKFGSTAELHKACEKASDAQGAGQVTREGFVTTVITSGFSASVADMSEVFDMCDVDNAESIQASSLIFLEEDDEVRDELLAKSRITSLQEWRYRRRSTGVRRARQAPCVPPPSVGSEAVAGEHFREAALRGVPQALRQAAGGGQEAEVCEGGVLEVRPLDVRQRDQVLPPPSGRGPGQPVYAHPGAAALPHGASQRG